jgi:hypothetical protein
MKKFLFATLAAAGVLAMLAVPSKPVRAACAVTNLQVKDNAAVTAAVPYADDGSGASNCSPQIQIKQGGNVAVVKPASTAVLATDPAFAVSLSPNSPMPGFAQSSTTSGQTGMLIQGAVTTGSPTYTTGQTNPLSLDTAGNLRVNVVAGGNSAPISDRQSSIGTLTTTAANHGACAINSCVTLNSQGAASVLIDISANTNVTLVVECAGPNNNYVACPAYPTGTAAPTGTTTLASSSTGQWIVPSGGFANVSVRVSVIGATPSATVALEANAGDNLALAAAWLSQLHTDLGGATPSGTNRIGFVTLQADTTGGATSFHALSAPSNNSTNVKASAGTVYSLTVINPTATLGDFRFVDSASAPTCSLGTGVIANYAVQPNTTSPGLHLTFPYGKLFTNGISFCLTGVTGTVTDNDNTSFVIGAQINIEWK